MSLIRKFSHARNILNFLRVEHWGLSQIPKIDDLEAHFSTYDSISLGLIDSNTLDIGCGANPRNPFKAKNVFGVDIRSNDDKNIKSADLAMEAIPFADNSFDYVTAHDFLEHIPRVIYAPNRKFAFVELMNEVWRTLKPNGIFLSRTPIFPYAQVFRDPTHVNILTHETFPLYFDDKNRMAQMYGFHGSFVVLNQAIRAPYLISILRKSA